MWASPTPARPEPPEPPAPLAGAYWKRHSTCFLDSRTRLPAFSIVHEILTGRDMMKERFEKFVLFGCFCFIIRIINYCID